MTHDDTYLLVPGSTGLVACVAYTQVKMKCPESERYFGGLTGSLVTPRTWYI